MIKIKSNASFLPFTFMRAFDWPVDTDAHFCAEIDQFHEP